MESCFEIAMYSKSIEFLVFGQFLCIFDEWNIFLFKNSLLIGTNATLPTWTMNDLLQINGNETKANTSTNSVTSPLKRASLRSRTQQSMTETNGVPQTTNHKRSSTHDSSITKRLKSNSTASSFSQDTANSSSKGNNPQQSFTIQSQETVQQQQQKSPHLLQHLMAPSPERIRKYNGPMSKNSSADKLSLDQQWTCNGTGVDVSKSQSSDSVLKNLLVSGCDISAGYICHVPVRLRKLAKA